MDIQSKPTFVPCGHHLFVCLFTCLSSFLFAFLPVCLLAFLFVYLSCGSSCFLPYAMLAMLIMLYASFIRSLHLFLSISYLLVSCLCLCMYTHGARTHGAQAQAKRVKMQACKYKPSGNVQQIQGSSLSHLVLYSFKPLSFLPPISLRWVVLGISCHIPFVLIS